MVDSRDRSRRHFAARVLRWSAAVALLAIPIVVVVSAIVEPRLRQVVNCGSIDCDVGYAEQHRLGPIILLVLVLWIVVSMIAATILDRRQNSS